MEGFEIVSELNKEHPVTIEYVSKKEIIKRRIDYRNNSILSHGVDPVDKDKYEKMEEIIKGFVQRFIPDIDERLKELEMCFMVDVIDSTMKQTRQTLTQ